MCGIIGIVGHNPVAERMLDSLERLEYRGYDSSGIAVFQEDLLVRYRVVGTLANLRQRLKSVPPLNGFTGIGHTRWATHGAPHESNAHPHFSHRIAVVHNGIIENFSVLKKMLLAKGYEFESETDSEVIAHLLDESYGRLKDIRKVFLEVLPQLRGSFAIACLIKDHPQCLVVARRGTPPLVVGKGQKETAVSSDALGLMGITKECAYLKDDTWALLEPESITAYDFAGQTYELQYHSNPFNEFTLDRGQYPHYMLKEIHEQPLVIKSLVNRALPNMRILTGKDVSHVTILGCGTSFYAGWVGKYFLESHYPVTLELASEFHYRRPRMIPGVTIALSQSGETADTLKAVEYAKSQGQEIISILNVPHSAIGRLSDHVIDTQAGLEVGVASTKSFVAQVWVMLALAGFNRGKDLPPLMEETLLLIPTIQAVAMKLASAQSLLYLGRGASYPMALEGALKMKELSYIHAEGMPAGELKHGSIALIDRSMPVVALAPYDDIFEKTVSNLHEIAAREGVMTILTDQEGSHRLGLSSVSDVLVLPSSPYPEYTPLLYALVLQLLAYYTALYKGCSIDKPRNLAKSVTVE